LATSALYLSHPLHGFPRFAPVRPCGLDFFRPSSADASKEVGISCERSMTAKQKVTSAAALSSCQRRFFRALEKSNVVSLYDRYIDGRKVSNSLAFCTVQKEQWIEQLRFVKLCLFLSVERIH
jgi:hypothetical protein